MGLRKSLRAAINRPLRPLGLSVERLNGGPSCVYDGDGLRILRRNLSFMSDPKFQAAYSRGMASGHKVSAGRVSRQKDPSADIGVQFRAYIECWAASQGLGKPGDFVFCGVNTGIFPLTVCDFLDINATDKTVWLFDTYAGVPKSQMAGAEIRHSAMYDEYYFDCYDLAAKNFSQFPRAKLVKGTVPETLTSVEIGKVAYLSIDMNIAYPERKALEFFWPKLAAGALVIFDDYAFFGHEQQRDAIDEFARSAGVSVLTLPTGQGMLMRP